MACLMAVLAASSPAGAGGPAQVPAAATAEHCKASVLYYLTQFVQWPARPGRQAFVIGVLGDEPLEAALVQVVGGRAIDGRPLLVRRLSRSGEVGCCRMVYLGSGAGLATISRFLKAAEAAGVLTVGESPAFEALGGMIDLVPAGQWAHLEINRGAVDRARLQISSRLLGLARVVEGRRQ